MSHDRKNVVSEKLDFKLEHSPEELLAHIRYARKIPLLHLAQQDQRPNKKSSPKRGE